MDDLKISYMNPKVVDNIIDILSKKYGREAPITSTRDKVHDHLLTIIDFSTSGKLVIRMDNYVKYLPKEKKEDTLGKSETP